MDKTILSFLTGVIAAVVLFVAAPFTGVVDVEVPSSPGQTVDVLAFCNDASVITVAFVEDINGDRYQAQFGTQMIVWADAPIGLNHIALYYEDNTETAIETTPDSEACFREKAVRL